MMSCQPINTPVNALKTGVVHLWRVTLPVTDVELWYYKSLLSKDELERANRFHFDKHREQYIVARGGLRKIISHYLNIMPQEIIISHNTYGKPFVDKVDLTFNLTHSGDQIVYAFTKNSPIGVDIEEIKDDLDFLSLAKMLFTKEEYLKFSNMSDKNRPLAFYRYWTRKEAFLKAVGTGLTEPLNQIQVSFGHRAKPQIIKITDKPEEQPFWRLHEIILENSCVASLAVRYPGSIQSFIYRLKVISEVLDC